MSTKLKYIDSHWGVFALQGVVALLLVGLHYLLAPATFKLLSSLLALSSYLSALLSYSTSSSAPELAIPGVFHSLWQFLRSVPLFLSLYL